MKDEDKAKEQLINELVETRQRVTELEASETERKRAEKALRASEERFQQVVENAEEWIWEVDTHGLYTYSSPVVEKILGYQPEEIIGQKHFYDLFHPEHREELKKAAFEVFAQKQSFREFINRNVHKNGKTVWLSTSGVPILNEKGNLLGYRGADTDITERVRAEEGIHQRTEDLTLINSLNSAINRGDSLQEVINILAEETKRIFSSHGATAYLLSEDKKHLVLQNLTLPATTMGRIEKLIGITIPAVRIPLKEGSLYLKAMQARKPQLTNDPETIQRLMAECTENKMLKKLIPGIYRVLGIRSVISVPFVSEGEAIGLLDVGRNAPFTESDMERLETISGQMTTIIKRKQVEETIRHLAYHDALTGLPNRMLLNDRLNLALAHAHRNQQKLAVMLLDLDHFKDVNDKLGHSMGDKLLQIVGERLTNLLRKSDTAARMGGDEFMLILPEVAQAKDVAEIAAKILEAIRTPMAFNEHEIHITTSVGIALYPDDGEDVDTLMKNADIAMYHAKDQGRDNCQRYTAAMSAKVLE